VRVGFGTRQIHAGTSADTATGARAVPIYQTTSFVFVIPHTPRRSLPLELGNIYTRIMNPTQNAFEERIASLEGGVAALAVSSGSSAETIAILNLAENGGQSSLRRRSTRHVQSLSLHLAQTRHRDTFVDNPDDLNECKRYSPNTKALYGETWAIQG